MNKRTNDELKANRPTISENKLIPKIPIFFLIENIRSVHNVGSIFRTADGIGCGKIFLSGYTAFPPRSDLSKVALGSENSVDWEQYDNPTDAANKIKETGIKLVSLEQTKSSISIYDFKWEFPVCIILGNEVKGVKQKVVDASDIVLEIPQVGTKHSFNISVSVGIVLWDLYSKIISKR